MTTIAEQLQQTRATLPADVELVAVSKYHPIERIMEAYDAGQRIFGENRVQELVEKAPQLPQDIEWHLIGTLQRNKVKYIVPFVHTIQSIDTSKLLDEVEQRCRAIGRRELNLLLQVHISGEETKHGFSITELDALLTSGVHQRLEYTRIVGLMAMASLTDDATQVEHEFSEMQALFERIKSTYFAADAEFRHLSIGMSEDYLTAIKHGATYVRIGSRIFGAREY